MSGVRRFGFHKRQSPQFRSKALVREANTYSFDFLIAIAALLVLSTNVVGFKSPIPTPCSRLKKSQRMSATENNPAIENWRVLPVPNMEDTAQYRLELSTRAAWSEETYRDSLELYESFMQCTDSYVAGPIQAALTCLDHSLRLYGPASVLCSFNGGKDAVVILHLVRAAFAKHYKQQSAAGKSSIVRPRVVFFDHADEFPEIIAFVRSTVTGLDLDMICFEQGTRFQDGLKVIVDNNCATADSTVVLPVATVLGTRLTDPNAVGQFQFAPSSHYMPPFMRVNPVLDWTYGHVWHFLRLFQLPYCCLYDQGYTSLGTMKDTLPCPALAVVGQKAAQSNKTFIPKYWPAYMLRDWDLERAGRVSKTKKNALPKKAKPSSGIFEADASSMGSHSTTSNLRVVLEKPRASDLDDEEEDDDDGDVIETTDSDDDESCDSYISDTVTQKTAGILIIGDEILKGFTADTNTQAAAIALHNKNVLLKYVVVVSDDLDDIAEEVQRMRTMVDVVITSGGLGGTHDDVTMKSVAAALGCGMDLHEEMAQLLRKKMNQDGDESTMLTEAQEKMATLPTYAKLRYLSKDSDDWPVLQCKNIFILPGIPDFFSKKIENVAEYLACQMERLPAYKVVLQVDENSIVPVLNQVVDNHPNVTFGSYPFVSHPEYKTVITVEGKLSSGPASTRRNSTIFDRGMIDSAEKTTDDDVRMALDELINHLPEGSVLRVDVDDLQMFSFNSKR